MERRKTIKIRWEVSITTVLHGGGRGSGVLRRGSTSPIWSITMQTAKRSKCEICFEGSRKATGAVSASRAATASFVWLMAPSEACRIWTLTVD